MRVRHMLGAVEDARRRKISELRNKGFEILEPEQASKLLGVSSRSLPDLVARHDDQVIIVEFAQRRSPAPLPDGVKSSLEEFSSVAEANDNWEFEVVWIGEYSQVPDESSVYALANRALMIAKHDESAGLLLAYAALEGAITRLAERTPELRDQARGLRPGLTQVASLGLIGSDDFKKLNSVRQARNSIAHGMDVPVSYEMVQDVVFAAERLADSRYVSPDQMVDWFFENYEDPANGVPFESREGGYQYILGGPFDARDVLTDQFPEASDSDIDQAVGAIESESHEWVEKGIY
ncbi:hypothetical protein ACWGJ2_04545 [Streptomyces sp. NPDC054796]